MTESKENVTIIDLLVTESTFLEATKTENRHAVDGDHHKNVDDAFDFVVVQQKNYTLFCSFAQTLLHIRTYLLNTF